MDKEPTEAEIKEFWEKCGFIQNVDLKSGYHWERTQRVGNWKTPDGQTTIGLRDGRLPPIDLNNLFKHAVPKLQHAGCVVNLDSNPNMEYTCQVLPRRTSQATYAEDKDPALALFWAIYEALELDK